MNGPSAKGDFRGLTLGVEALAGTIRGNPVPFFIVWLDQVSTTSGPGYETIEEATSAAESSAALRPAYTRKFVIVEANDPREALFKATGMPKPPGMR